MFFVYYERIIKFKDNVIYVGCINVTFACVDVIVLKYF